MERILKVILNKESLTYGLTVISILLLLWQILIFRKTFIEVKIPLMLMIVSGLLIFALFRNKIADLLKLSPTLFWQAVHSVIIFGGFSVFIFMASNFYFASNSSKDLDLMVVKIGQLGKGRRGCGEPYALVFYNNFEKQLVFPCDKDLEGVKQVRVRVVKGLFGYLVVREMKPIIIESKRKIEL
jgi:hypothetical protein